MESIFKLINKLNVDLLDGYKHYGIEYLNIYTKQVLSEVGNKNILEIHKKARHLYYRFLVLEQFKDKDDEFVNEKTTEFLHLWNETEEKKDKSRAIKNLCNIKEHKQLILLVKIIIDVLKTYLLVEKALELKAKQK